MTRYARVHAPGVVHHVIARFVNRAFRMDGSEARLEYLRRLQRVVARCQWKVLGYALMSSHVHLVLLSGPEPSSRLVQPLHTGFALWLNRRSGALGPAFAERHTTVLVDDAEAGRLLAYVHNNPVRAGLATWAGELAWTSHRAYLGIDPAPPWLDVSRGLELSGCATRGEFDALVRRRAGDPRDPWLSDEPRRERRVARKVTGAPIEVSWPVIEDARRRFSILRATPALRPRFPGTPEEVVELVKRLGGGGSRPFARGSRDAVRMRRLAMLVWVAHLGRAQADMARCLGISDSAASRLLTRSPEALAELAHEAEWVAAICWEGARQEAEVGKVE